MTSGGRTRAPIALQVVALLVLSLVVVQLVTFAAVLLIPPPARAVYRMEEVARALKGGPLDTRYGHQLVRSFEDVPPAEPPPRVMREGEPPRIPFTGARRQLAALLGVNEADVRLIEKPPFPSLLLHLSERGHGMFMDRAKMFDREGGPMGPAPGPPPERSGFPASAMPPPAGDMAFVARGPVGPGMGGDRRAFFFGDRPLFGEFTAAVRQANGKWLVVRPQPERFPNDWQRGLLYRLVGCLLVTAPLGYLFARRITAPIGRFARAAEALGRDPSGPLMALSGPAEIGMAARAFNDMQARVKRYIEDRTAMVGAISHDLRTPLARIRFKLEGAPEPVRAAIASDLDQMEQMISSVLSFIRDASAGRPHERMDLLSLLEVLTDDAVLIGQDVILAEAVAATVEADELGLRRMFGNLLDNAVKYGGSAVVRLTVADGHVVVEITDRGPGLASSELERVFQPFYRMEAARTLDGGGVGLGLAVARSIARAHGGDVTLSSTTAGLTARVRLPLSAG